MRLVNLALAAEQFAQSQPSITVDAMLCLHARDKEADCDRCVAACPAGAISLEDGLQVDANACVRCGLCLHICPTGALSAANNVHRLLYCVSQLVDRENIEIACPLHHNPDYGDPKVDAVITLTGCLATLGVSAYLSLAAQNVRRVRVRLDACDQCPLASLVPQIETTIRQASSLLKALDRQQTVTVTEPVQRLKRRPVYSVKNPPVSRRGFFQVIGQRGRDILPSLDGDSERDRLIAALRCLAPDNSEYAVPDDDFTTLSVTDTCNACTTCARICPTGALAFARDENSFQIAFMPSACVNCGLCLKFCEPQAINRQGAPTIGAIISDEPVVLYSGQLTRCRKCNTLFAAKSGEDLCTVCAFRARNPFGIRRNSQAAPQSFFEDSLKR